MVQRVFGRAFELCRNPAYVVPALLIPCLAVIVPVLLVGPATPTPPHSLNEFGAFFLRSLARMVITVAFTWPYMTLVALAMGLLRGENASYFEKWVDFGVFVRAFLVDFVRFIIIGVGLLVLIAPGIFVMIIWSQTEPLLIDRRSQFFDALEDSKDLTAGSRGEIFLLFLAITILTLLGVSLDIGMRRLFHLQPESWIARAPSMLWTAPIGAFNTALFTALYLELLKTVPQLTQADFYLAPGTEPLQR